jgi:replicative DNA helicase Mcm
MTEHDPREIYRNRADDYQQFLQQYCKDELGRVAEGYPKDTTQFTISLRDLFQWESDTAHDVHENPELFCSVFKYAVEEANVPVELEGIRVTFTDASDPMGVPELLRGDHEGKLVTLRGQVSKTSEVVPRVTVANIKCENCHQEYDVPVPEHGEIGMDRCPDGQCGSKAIHIVFDESEWTYHQLSRIRPPAEQSDGDSHIDVHLTGDIAGSVSNGDRVDIDGVLNAHFEEPTDPHPEFYLKGHNVTHHQSDYKTIETQEHKEKIDAYASGEHGDPYELLINSIAPVLTDPNPDVEGLSKLKAMKLAIGLQLFGGWRREISTGNYARGDSHICLIGDPSTGKSRLLNAAAELSPRSSMASGKNATKAGITAAAVRDDFGETEWSLDSGAIVNAHKGICCIDEIDKVSGEVVSSLHSALEKQRLEVTKAGIDATLKCETALLAAGNPEDERFNNEVETYQQLNIEPALYSRFDLVFTLEDQPQEEQDKRIATQALDARIEAGKVARGDKEDAETVDPAIPMNVLRAYIAYARQNIYPIIRDETVKDELVRYHTEIREKSSDSSPITHRKLDALLRLCEASARVRLSEEITMQDVELVKDVVGVSLADVNLKDGEFGDFAESVEVKRSQQQSIEAIKNTLRGTQMSVEEIVEETGLEEDYVESRLAKLSDSGVVYKPIQGSNPEYRLT